MENLDKIVESITKFTGSMDAFKILMISGILGFSISLYLNRSLGISLSIIMIFFSALGWVLHAFTMILLDVVKQMKNRKWAIVIIVVTDTLLSIFWITAFAYCLNLVLKIL